MNLMNIRIMHSYKNIFLWIVGVLFLQSCKVTSVKPDDFAKPNQYAKHNTNYWRGIHYLGIGPSAHSFNGQSRQWNIANNAKYIQEITLKKVPFTLETLSLENKFNEYIMTSLRTQWGIDLAKIELDFGINYKNKLLTCADEYMNDNLLALDDEKLKLTPKGKLLADKIASDLFITDDEF